MRDLARGDPFGAALERDGKGNAMHRLRAVAERGVKDAALDRKSVV